MELLSTIALVLLTLVGYSSGTVLVARPKRPVPALLDLLIVVALWALALAFREDIGRWWSLLAGVSIGMAVGAARAALHPHGQDPAQSGLRRPADHGHAGAVGRRGPLGAWTRFAAEMGNFQGRMLVSFFYFIVLAPFAIASRPFTDPLRLRTPAAGSSWLPAEARSADLSAARRQF